jgi:hypothetical protein
LLEQVIFDETDRNLRLDIAPLFRHAQGHAELYRTLAWGSGFDLITMQGQASLSAKILQRLSPYVSAEEPPIVPLSILSYSRPAVC